MNKTLNYHQLKSLANKYYKNGWVERKTITLSKNPDIVDRTLEKSNEIVKKLHKLLNI